MIKGAKYELKRNKGDTQLGWKIIQLVERRKTRSITRTVAPDGLTEEKCGGLADWYNHKGAKEDHVLKQATMTVDEYDWVVLADGEPNTIDEEAWIYEVISHYDFIGFGELAMPGDKAEAAQRHDFANDFKRVLSSAAPAPVNTDAD